VQIVAMDGFGGYKTAATQVVPQATAVMDPFHVVALAGADSNPDLGTNTERTEPLQPRENRFELHACLVVPARIEPAGTRLAAT